MTAESQHATHQTEASSSADNVDVAVDLTEDERGPSGGVMPPDDAAVGSEGDDVGDVTAETWSAEDAFEYAKEHARRAPEYDILAPDAPRAEPPMVVAAMTKLHLQNLRAMIKWHRG